MNFLLFLLILAGIEAARAVLIAWISADDIECECDDTKDDTDGATSR